MESDAFEGLAREHKDRVYGYAVMMLRDPADAQDVAQEALVRLWQQRERVDRDGARAWLSRTTHNLCIDRLRRRRVRSEVGAQLLEMGLPDGAPGPHELTQSDELGRLIERALGALSPQDRAVLVLREVQGLPYEEIARTLELPLGTLKARLHRARDRLRAKLTGSGVTP